MGRLVYSALASLDGFIEDPDGRFDWAAPGHEVHAFVNDQMRSVTTHLYGRRMYETMRAWETIDDPEPVMRDFAQLWRAAEKVVYSSTLDEVAGERTRIERVFDPVAVRAMKEQGDLAVGGPGIAAEAFKAGLVDEVQMFLSPIAVGGGKPALPQGLRIELELREQRRFEGGVVFVRYEVR